MKKRLIIFILVIALLFSLTACGKKNPDESAAPQEKILSYTESEILKNLENSIGMWEFAQSFFDDLFIYKSKLGTWSYQAVDPNLPMNDYNWDNLRHAGVIGGTEWEYYLDGELKSIKGIDISVYNKVTDWDAVKADGVEFAMIRTGYRGYSTGKFLEDSKFAEHARGARAAGIEVGAYFVTQAVSVSEAIEEAEWVLDKIQKAGVDFNYPIALDLEDAGSDSARTVGLSASDRTEIIIAFCERIKAAGYKPMLYSNVRWYLEEMELSELTEYNKWFAQYFNRPFFPYEFQIWQYTSSGNVDGIEGVVDLNLCMYNFAGEEQ